MSSGFRQRSIQEEYKLYIHQFGWNDNWAAKFSDYEALGYSAGRVVVEHKHQYRVWTNSGELLAEVTGKLRFEALSQADFPAVGDWVVLSERIEEKRASIHAVLPRMSKFSRKVAGNVVDEQVVAANVDTVFIVTALNHDFNLRRLERTLTLAWESGANPAIVLSKADLCEDVSRKLAEVNAVAPFVPVHVTSSMTEDDEGIEDLQAYLTEGQTIALLGSSGVGKSTLINRLMGDEVMAVGGIRESDDRGRHTTTHRELLVLPSGTLVIDTPGMRELQLWASDDGLSTTFDDVEAIARQCRFSDCTHVSEPGCAVQEAIGSGSLSIERYKNYQKMLRELAHLEKKAAGSLRSDQRRRGKQMSKAVRSKHKQR